MVGETPRLQPQGSHSQKLPIKYDFSTYRFSRSPVGLSVPERCVAPALAPLAVRVANHPSLAASSSSSSEYR
jgi:hypothetical protein